MFIEKPKKTLANQYWASTKNGDACPDSQIENATLDTLIQSPGSFEEFRGNHPDVYKDYLQAVKKQARFRHSFANHLERTLNPIENFGIDIIWKETQRMAIEAIIHDFHHGFRRLALQLPTGTGKSMVFGAIARAFLETGKQLPENNETKPENRDDPEIILLTSRVNLVGQMTEGVLGSDYSAACENPVSPPEMSEEEEGGSINMGDVVLWTKDILPEEQVRILRSDMPYEHQLTEKNKDAVLTVGTLQGLNQKRITQMHNRCEPLLLLDEAHHLTDRLRALIQKNFPGSTAIGMSATINGPDRDPFLYFEEIINEKLSETERRIRSWKKKISLYVSLDEAISRKELKPVRWIEADTNIKVDTAFDHRTRHLHEGMAAELMLSNIGLLKTFMKKVFRKRYPLLDVANSKPLKNRKHIVFVPTLDIAQELAEYCSSDLNIPAQWVSYKTSQSEFDRIKADFRSGAVKMLFSCQKLTEGFDEVTADCVWPLQVMSSASEWQLVQQIGRGMRKNPTEPNADCVIIDPLFHARDKTLVATTLKAFGATEAYTGGLLAPGKMRDVEMKVLQALQSGMDEMMVQNMLSPEERAVMAEIWKGPINYYTGDTGTKLNGEHSPEAEELLAEIRRIELIRKPHLIFDGLLDDIEKLRTIARQELAHEGYHDAMSIIGANKYKPFRKESPFRDISQIEDLVVKMASANAEKNDNCTFFHRSCSAQVCELLGYEIMPDEEFKNYLLDILEKNNISCANDVRSLSNWRVEILNLGKIGKWKGFCNYFHQERSHFPSKNNLNRIAYALFEHPSAGVSLLHPNKMEARFHELMEKNNIGSRYILWAMRDEELEDIDFEEFGNIYRFAAIVGGTYPAEIKRLAECRQELQTYLFYGANRGAGGVASIPQVDIKKAWKQLGIGSVDDILNNNLSALREKKLGDFLNLDLFYRVCQNDRGAELNCLQDLASVYEEYQRVTAQKKQENGRQDEELRNFAPTQSDRDNALDLLEKLGIKDRFDLLIFGSVKLWMQDDKDQKSIWRESGFKNKDEFGVRIMGRKRCLQSEKNMVVIADKLGFPPLTPAVIKERTREVLALGGIQTESIEEFRKGILEKLHQDKTVEDATMVKLFDIKIDDQVSHTFRLYYVFARAFRKKGDPGSTLSALEKMLFQDGSS